MDLDLNATVVANNELWRILTFFGVITGGLIVAKVCRSILKHLSIKLAKKGRRVISITLRTLSRALAFVAFAVSFPIAMAFLTIPESAKGIVDTVQTVLFIVAVGFVFYQLTDVVTAWMRHMTSKTKTKMDDMLIPIVHTSLRITVVVLTLLQIAQSLTDKPLTSLIAGLGVTGLAVALAAQDTIKHFFGSVVIFADQPFQVGDLIESDGITASVEEVGFRSTKLRTLTGFQVTMPNGELANKTITNISRRPSIRHKTSITVTYDTEPVMLEKAMNILKDILENHDGMDEKFPPRVFFEELASASLNIVVMFWYHPGDYWQYMAFVDKFNMQVLKRFNEAGIDFAFPTQTVYLAGDDKRPLSATIHTGANHSSESA